jgi:hypothetical protein
VVQVLNIIISIVRTKLIAVFIGPAGMGISLLNSAINIISGVSGLGSKLVLSNISGKHKENDLSSVSTMVSTVKKLVLVTGILARYWRYFFLVVEAITFGNTDYTLIFISVTVLLKQLASGQLVVLQA